jgi:tetratricopeptide (TPR) repeat protein
LDSAIALLRDAREVEPKEPDVRLWEAKVLAWQGKYKDAIARYDSLIAERADNRDARFGRAQALAWSGRNDEADRAYRSLTAANPNDAEALLGLAQLRMWQGRPDLADHYTDLALYAAPNDRAAQALRAEIRAYRRPRLDLSLGWSHDSDQNNAWWQSVSTSMMLHRGFRGFASAGLYEASDPTENGTRLSGEIGAVWSSRSVSLTGAVGVRKLTSDFGINRSPGTWRAVASYRVAPSAGVGVAYSHYSFDETAFLLANNVDIDELSADGEVQLGQSLSLGAGLGLGLISDDNKRKSMVLSLNDRVMSRLNVGVFGRALWYDKKGNGYFSPDRFLLGEVRGTLSHAVRRWEVRAVVGVGFQQSGQAGSTDGEWHTDLRLARRWSVINEVALAGGISNSAISSASGAFHYYTAVLSARLGL